MDKEVLYTYIQTHAQIYNGILVSHKKIMDPGEGRCTFQGGIHFPQPAETPESKPRGLQSQIFWRQGPPGWGARCGTGPLLLGRPSAVVIALLFVGCPFPHPWGRRRDAAPSDGLLLLVAKEDLSGRFWPFSSVLALRPPDSDGFSVPQHCPNLCRPFHLVFLVSLWPFIYLRNYAVLNLHCYNYIFIGN